LADLEIELSLVVPVAPASQPPSLKVGATQRGTTHESLSYNDWPTGLEAPPVRACGPGTHLTMHLLPMMAGATRGMDGAELH
jgi:hypothetical protein